MTAELDLFWAPAVGELVELSAERAADWWSRAEAKFPQRVTRITEFADWFWVVSTGPIRQRTNTRGRVIREEPSVQTAVHISDIRQLAVGAAA